MGVGRCPWGDFGERAWVWEESVGRCGWDFLVGKEFAEQKFQYIQLTDSRSWQSVQIGVVREEYVDS